MCQDCAETEDGLKKEEEAYYKNLVEKAGK